MLDNVNKRDDIKDKEDNKQEEKKSMKSKQLTDKDYDLRFSNMLDNVNKRDDIKDKEDNKQEEKKSMKSKQLTDKDYDLRFANMLDKIYKCDDIKDKKKDVKRRNNNINILGKGGNGSYGTYNICWEFNTFPGCRKGSKCKWQHKYLLKEAIHPRTGEKLNGMAVRQFRLLNNI
eukprot:457413_1